MRRLFFHEESIHVVSRPYLEPPYIHTYTHTHGQAETNMSPLFQSWGHNEVEVFFILQIHALNLRSCIKRKMRLKDLDRKVSNFLYLYFRLPKHGVQRRMISVVKFFVFFILFFALLLLNVT